MPPRLYRLLRVSMFVAAIGVGLIVIVTALENGRGGEFSRLYDRAKEEIRARVDDRTNDGDILTMATGDATPTPTSTAAPSAPSPQPRSCSSHTPAAGA